MIKKAPKTYLASFDAGNQTKMNPKIFRVLLGENYTRIDFGYVAPWLYIRGGWIRIAPETFIQVKGSEKRYRLTDAKNIPIYPAHHHFSSTADWCVFSLFFEPIPIKDAVIDLIEAENPSDTDFNYYNIILSYNPELFIESSY
jgi:hypothetical protein